MGGHLEVRVGREVDQVKGEGQEGNKREGRMTMKRERKLIDGEEEEDRWRKRMRKK